MWIHISTDPGRILALVVGAVIVWAMMGHGRPMRDRPLDLGLYVLVLAAGAWELLVNVPSAP